MVIPAVSAPLKPRYPWQGLSKLINSARHVFSYSARRYISDRSDVSISRVDQSLINQSWSRAVSAVTTKRARCAKRCATVHSFIASSAYLDCSNHQNMNKTYILKYCIFEMLYDYIDVDCHRIRVSIKYCSHLVRLTANGQMRCALTELLELQIRPEYWEIFLNRHLHILNIIIFFKYYLDVALIETVILFICNIFLCSVEGHKTETI